MKVLKKSMFTPFAVGIVCAVCALTITAPRMSWAHDEHGAHEEKSGHHFEPEARPAVTAPAAHYSGRTPVDRTNGNFFNVGTYGVRNPGYEKWAQSSTWAVSLAELPYDYDQKDRFVSTLDERIRHFEMAVWNYEHVSDISKPEGKAHAEKAAADLKPRIEKARDSWSKAKSAGRGNWDSAQDEAKRSFLELQSFYYGMHNNVR